MNVEEEEEVLGETITVKEKEKENILFYSVLQIVKAPDLSNRLTIMRVQNKLFRKTNEKKTTNNEDSFFANDYKAMIIHVFEYIQLEYARTVQHTYSYIHKKTKLRIGLILKGNEDAYTHTR